MESNEILSKLNRARRALDALSQVEIIDEWEFDKELNIWHLHLGITIDYETKYFPQISKWYVVDAAGCTLGRLASEVAKVLRGKNKPIFTPHIDTGDYVIVVNAEKVKVTGKKLLQKVYYNHSDYVGGMKETTLKEMLAKHPERVIEYAVKGMLPKGPLGRQMYTKLFVYAGPDHKHAAQKPEVLTF